MVSVWVAKEITKTNKQNKTKPVMCSLNLKYVVGSKVNGNKISGV